MKIKRGKKLKSTYYWIPHLGHLYFGSFCWQIPHSTMALGGMARMKNSGVRLVRKRRGGDRGGRDYRRVPRECNMKANYKSLIPNDLVWVKRINLQLISPFLLDTSLATIEHHSKKEVKFNHRQKSNTLFKWIL